MNEWKLIKAKFQNNCKECGFLVGKGEEVYWKKGEGIKHKKCPETQAVIETKKEKPKVWKDPKEYPYKELDKIKKCQRCGNVLFGDVYIDDNRKVCHDCF